MVVKMSQSDNLEQRVDSLVAAYFETLEARKSQVFGKDLRVKQQKRAAFKLTHAEADVVKIALIWFEEMLALDRDAPQGMVKMTAHLRQDIFARYYANSHIFFLQIYWDVTEFHIVTRALELWCQQTGHEKTDTYIIAKNLLKFFERGRTYPVQELPAVPRLVPDQLSGNAEDHASGRMPAPYEDPQGGMS
jgi:hypothetical protein